MSSVVNIQQGEWTKIGVGEISFQVLGDRGVYYAESNALPVGRPVSDVVCNFALPRIQYNYRRSNRYSKLYVYATDNNGTNIAVDKPVYNDIFIQDQTTAPVEHLLTYIKETCVMQENALKNTREIILNAGAGATIVDIINNTYYIEIRYNETLDPDFPNVRFIQSEIIGYVDNITSVAISIGTPLDIDIDVAYVETIYITDANASRVSQLASPTAIKEMCTFPPDNLSWDITGLMISAVLSAQPDDGKFLSRLPLTYGIYFGFSSPLRERHLVNIKSNSDFGASAYDITYVTRSLPTSSYGLRVRKFFNGQNNYGVTIRLNGNTEKYCLYLQEAWNLETIDNCIFKIIGHEVD